jgi:asparagine synthase (glutamine-hydrolysing)
MCGIAGIVRQDGQPVDTITLRRMTDILAHRGPDGEGIRLDGPVGLGHRRLAIIDLVAGAQPMISDDGATWITYNGEIYNFRELRRELSALGARFRTNSDTEVILRGYEAWGIAVIPRLRGMFAFGIWDARRRQLLLARDRLGIKPLVYGWDGHCLRFASELKALLTDTAVPRDLDWAAVRDYFTYHCVPGPRTIFRDIQKLPPASYLLCSLDGGKPEIGRYWHLPMAPDRRLSEAEWCERLRHVLDETTRLHMISDVPLGAFLSGGVDSSAVVARMAQNSTQPVKTFSIGFDEPDFDELAYARLVARRYGTEHVELVIRPDIVDVLPRLAWQFDEPFADASAVPTYCVSKITREHVTVALSGDGGDENFAGYRRYAEVVKLAGQADRWPLALAKPLARAIAARLPIATRGRGSLELIAMSPLERYHRKMTFQTDATLATMLTASAHEQVMAQPRSDSYARLAAQARTEDYVSTLQYIDLHHYLPEDILTKVDRTSMLVSLETRVPLLDHVLVEFAARIPSSLKLRGERGKHILKQAMAHDLPREVLTRSKMGFGVPIARWFQTDLKDFVVDVLADRRAGQRGIVRPEVVKQLLATHRAGHHDRSPQLWALICFELWCRTWLDR